MANTFKFILSMAIGLYGSLNTTTSEDGAVTQRLVRSQSDEALTPKKLEEIVITKHPGKDATATEKAAYHDQMMRRVEDEYAEIKAEIEKEVAEFTAKAATSSISKDEAEKLFHESWKLRQADQDAEAFNKMKQAADAGHKQAQHALARMYASGIGTESNKDEAINYYIACHKEIVIAATALGGIFMGYADPDYRNPLASMYFYEVGKSIRNKDCEPWREDCERWYKELKKELDSGDFSTFISIE